MTVETELTDLVDAHARGAVVVDVREPDEYAGGHVPGAVNVPLAEAAARAAELPTHARVFVVCASGKRSAKATDALRVAGLDAVSVRGGTLGWVQAGLPVTSGARP